MKITDEEITSHSIRKIITIELDNGEQTIIHKWLYDDSSLAIPEYDWEIDEEYKEAFDELPKKEQDKLINFIEDIKL